MTDKTAQRDYRSFCPIVRSLDLLGDKWTLVIMRDVLIFKRHTFAEFEQSGEGIPTNLLSGRLKKLVELGFLEKVLYQSQPNRYRYEATAKAKDLRPVLRSLGQFGEKHLGGQRPPKSRA